MTTVELKSRAKRLRTAVTEMFGVNVSHSQSLELVAKEDNFPDWNAVAACCRVATSNPNSLSGNATLPTTRLNTAAHPSAFHSLDELGFAPSHVALLNTALQQESGLILIVGHVGTGKSQTFATLLHNSITNDVSKKVYSIEHPVERFIPGVMQTSQQDWGRDVKYAERIDPAVIGISEIRDRESATAAVRLLMSGRLIITTIHGGSALDGLQYLRKLGTFDDALLNGALPITVVFQRLIPTLYADGYLTCPASDRVDSSYLNRLSTTYRVNTETMRCSAKDGVGVSGFTIAAEVIDINNDIRRALQRGDTVSAEKLYLLSRTTGFDQADMTGKTAQEHAIFKSLR